MTATGIRWKPGFDWQAEKITILDRNIEKKSSGCPVGISGVREREGKGIVDKVWNLTGTI